MSTTTEQEQTTVEAVVPPSETSAEVKSVEPPPVTDEPIAAAAAANQPVVEEHKASWFNSFGISPNLTNQLSNLSSSILQVTSKVSAAANTLIEKSKPQRPSSPDQESKIVEVTNDEAPQTSEIETEHKDLSSILTDLSSTVMKSAQQFKHAVEEKSLLGSFTKEHEKFMTEKRTQQRREEAAVAPWIGYKEEEDMKKQILALSQEKRNFLRSPPPGANYHFDMKAMYPIALATLDEDENLSQMRFDLVPKQINEETFWRNYFYRVSLIKQSTQLSALANENTAAAQSTESSSKDRVRTSSSETTDKSHDVNQEFVSEDYDTSAVSMDDIRREIEQLTVTKKSPNKTNINKAGSPGEKQLENLDESEWDKALADELDNVSAEELEAQINQMLAGDTK